jgi:FkbM family methyltransferase
MMAMNGFLKEALFSSTAPGRALKRKPLGFVDIGARGGVNPVVEPLAGVTAVLAFEPDKNECARIKTGMTQESPYAQFRLVPCAVGRVSENARIYRYAAPGNNSFLTVNRPVVDRYKIQTFEECGSQLVPTNTLDRYIFEQLTGEDYWGELLKLDTQGMEYEILEGAQRTLSERTVAIIAEVEFFQMYAGQRLFSDIELRLRSHGFSFYGFTKMSYRSRKQLDKRTSLGRERILWADAVFFKDPFPGGAPTEALSERGKYTLFVSALLLGYYDFALEVALRTWAQGEEAERINALVRRCAFYPPESSCQEIQALSRRVEERPALANIEIGRFVDQRRSMWDYDDVASTVTTPLETGNESIR